MRGWIMAAKWYRRRVRSGVGEADTSALRRLRRAYAVSRLRPTYAVSARPGVDQADVSALGRLRRANASQLELAFDDRGLDRRRALEVVVPHHVAEAVGLFELVPREL